MADMTASELYELVTRPSPGLPDGWPEEVRPPLLEYKACGGERGWFDDDSYTAVSLAVLAHVASAVEWLGKAHWEVALSPRGPTPDSDAYGWSVIADKSYDGPTLLHALDAAVRAVGGG